MAHEGQPWAPLRARPTEATTRCQSTIVARDRAARNSRNRRLRFHPRLCPQWAPAPCRRWDNRPVHPARSQDALDKSTWPLPPSACGLEAENPRAGDHDAGNQEHAIHAYDSGLLSFPTSCSSRRNAVYGGVLEPLRPSAIAHIKPVLNIKLERPLMLSSNRAAIGLPPVNNSFHEKLSSTTPVKYLT